MVTPKTSDEKNPSKKAENYNPVNMAGKKADGPKNKEDQPQDAEKARKSEYNPVNMAGRKAGTSSQ